VAFKGGLEMPKTEDGTLKQLNRTTTNKSTQEPSTLDFALSYLKRGWSLFPGYWEGTSDKKKLVTPPDINGWKRYQQHPPSELQVREWYERWPNLGCFIVTGLVSDLVVVDLDNPAMREIWELKAPTVQTPRGLHLYFRHPHVPLRNKVKVQGQAVDVRADGGCVAAPPTMHPSGVRYRWLTPLGDELPPLPDWLINLLADKSDEKSDKEIRGRETDSAHEVMETVLKMCAFLKHCEKDAAILSYTEWWVMTHILATFGELARATIHRLSVPFPGYSSKDTDYQIRYAEKAHEKGIGPQTCLYIRDQLGFNCPSDCPAHKHKARSPVDLGLKLEKKNYLLRDDKTGKVKLDLESLATDLLSEFHFKAMMDTEEILVYQNGFWRFGGEGFIKAECEQRVGVKAVLSHHNISEVIGHVTRSTYCSRSEFNKDRWTINLNNGLLDVRTRELKPHTPEFWSTVRIPLTYNPGADCPRVRQFFSEVLESQDIPLIKELFGYALIPDYSIQRAFLFVGGGSNGKSKMLGLVKAFVGKDNTSNIPWQALELNRFATANLDGKLVNLFADLPSKSLAFTTAFKMLTGGDTLCGEKKFRDSFSFVNFARLVFSANKPPKIYDDDSYAFWRRWIIVNFPNSFPEDDPKTDPEILEKITIEAELSGLLNIALDGLARLLTNHKFSYDKSVEDTADLYLKTADPVYAFVSAKYESDSEVETPKGEIYTAFTNYCLEQKIPLLKPNSFARALQNQTYFRVTSTRPRIGIGNERVPCWKGIALKPVSVDDLDNPGKDEEEPF
jgi:putative DNA primase/helicase